MCIPRFDSPSVFGALLDRGGGRFRLGPHEAVPVARRYQPGTNILETTWATKTGWLVVIDALTIGPWRPRPDDPHTRPPPDLDAECVLVRVATCVQGEVPVELTCHPRFDYSRTEPGWELADDRHSATTHAEDQPTAVLTTDLNLGLEIERVEARHLLKDGESCFAALSWSADPRGPTTCADAFDRLDRTAEYWRRWLANGEFPDHPWRIHLQRSALTLKGLTYAPSGALIAALTTSLPETPGGERNWDYRYTWIRDATFTLWSMHVLGLDEEADDFARFIGDICHAHGNRLQIMYGIGGERELTEIDPRPPERLRRREAGAHRQRRLRPAAKRRLRGAGRLALHPLARRPGIPPEARPILAAQVESARRRSGTSPTRGSGRRAGRPSTTSPRS